MYYKPKLFLFLLLLLFLFVLSFFFSDLMTLKKTKIKNKICHVLISFGAQNDIIAQSYGDYIRYIV